MKTLIVGAGEMGRWFAAALETDVAFADVVPEAAESAAEAARRRIGKRARSVPLDTEEHFGLVCVAVPLPAVAEAVSRHAPKAQQAVVDVTGSMGPPLDAMARAAPARERMSLHPLFSAENAPGTVAVSTGASGPATDRIRRALESSGNELVDVPAAEHDEAMRTVQGRAHAAILAFGLVADDVPDGISTPVYEGLVELVSQVTGGTPRVYADIQETFDGAADVAEAARRIAEADRNTFEALYEDARPR